MTAPCLVCGDALRFVYGYGWSHSEGGLYVMTCGVCGWKGAPRPSPRACPECGNVRELRDNHCAQPGRVKLQEGSDA